MPCGSDVTSWVGYVTILNQDAQPLVSDSILIHMRGAVHSPEPECSEAWEAVCSTPRSGRILWAKRGCVWPSGKRITCYDSWTPRSTRDLPQLWLGPDSNDTYLSFSHHIPWVLAACMDPSFTSPRCPNLQRVRNPSVPDQGSDRCGGLWWGGELGKVARARQGHFP